MSSSLNELGFDGLKNVPGDGRTFPLTTERQERMRERLDAGATEEDDVCTLRGNDVRLILQNEFGVVRSRSAVYDFLHRLGYSHLRPRPRHRKSDPRAQADFQKQLPQRLAEIAETGHGEGLLSPRLNAGGVQAFLDECSQTVVADEHAVMICGTERAFITTANFEPEKRHAHPSAAVQPGTQPNGKPMALPKKPLLVKPGLRRLRGGGHRRLAKGRPQPGINQNRLKRSIPQTRCLKLGLVLFVICKSGVFFNSKNDAENAFGRRSRHRRIALLLGQLWTAVTAMRIQLQSRRRANRSPRPLFSFFFRA